MFKKIEKILLIIFKNIYHLEYEIFSCLEKIVNFEIILTLFQTFNKIWKFKKFLIKFVKINKNLNFPLHK